MKKIILLMGILGALFIRVNAQTPVGAATAVNNCAQCGIYVHCECVDVTNGCNNATISNAGGYPVLVIGQTGATLSTPICPSGSYARYWVTWTSCIGTSSNKFVHPNVMSPLPCFGEPNNAVLGPCTDCDMGNPVLYNIDWQPDGLGWYNSIIDVGCP